MKEEMVGLGYALKRYYARFEDANGSKRIILQTVPEDWTSMRYDLPLERTAAVVHLQSALMASRMLQAWKLKVSEYPNFRDYWKLISTHLKDVKMTLDLRADIWELAGNNIAAVDSGLYDEVEARNRTVIGCFHDFITTTSGSQVAQGAAEMEHLPMWDVPLLPRDGRFPPAQFLPPVWDPYPIVMMTASAFQQGRGQKTTRGRSERPKAHTAGGESQSSTAGASPKGPPRAKSRPKEPQEPSHQIGSFKLHHPDICTRNLRVWITRNLCSPHHYGWTALTTSCCHSCRDLLGRALLSLDGPSTFDEWQLMYAWSLEYATQGW